MVSAATALNHDERAVAALEIEHGASQGGGVLERATVDAEHDVARPEADAFGCGPASHGVHAEAAGVGANARGAR